MGEDHGGAVHFTHCPHLDNPAAVLIDANLLVPTKHSLPSALGGGGAAACAHGCDSVEQWVCLQCGGVHCGRYVNSHALEHHRANSTHMIAASLADLSVHCYKCDAYVRHPRLKPLLARLRYLKRLGMDSGLVPE